MKKALLLIDLQNDYFPDGKFPLWNTDVTLNNIVRAIRAAQDKGIPIIHIQHIANPKKRIKQSTQRVLRTITDDLNIIKIDGRIRIRLVHDVRKLRAPAKALELYQYFLCTQ